MSHTNGEATVHFDMPINGIKSITVGILETKKCIAICGRTNADDFEESRANAIRIAALWNRANRIS